MEILPFVLLAISTLCVLEESHARVYKTSSLFWKSNSVHVPRVILKPRRRHFIIKCCSRRRCLPSRRPPKLPAGNTPKEISPDVDSNLPFPSDRPDMLPEAPQDSVDLVDVTTDNQNETLDPEVSADDGVTPSLDKDVVAPGSSNQIAANSDNNPAGLIASNPAADSAGQIASNPAFKPGGQIASNPAGQIAANPAYNPGDQIASNPATNPAGQIASNPAGQIASNPATNPAGQIASNSAGQIATYPAGQITSNPAINPASQIASNSAAPTDVLSAVTSAPTAMNSRTLINALTSATSSMNNPATTTNSNGVTVSGDYRTVSGNIITNSLSNFVSTVVTSNNGVASTVGINVGKTPQQQEPVTSVATNIGVSSVSSLKLETSTPGGPTAITNSAGITNDETTTTVPPTNGINPAESTSVTLNAGLSSLAAQSTEALTTTSQILKTTLIGSATDITTTSKANTADVIITSTPESGTVTPSVGLTVSNAAASTGSSTLSSEGPTGVSNTEVKTGVTSTAAPAGISGSTLEVSPSPTAVPTSISAGQTTVTSVTTAPPATTALRTTGKTTTTTTGKPTTCKVATCPKITCIKDNNNFEANGDLKTPGKYGVWKQISSNTYMYGNTFMKQPEAWTFCCSIGMELVSLNSPTKFTNIIKNKPVAIPSGMPLKFWGSATSAGCSKKFRWCPQTVAENELAATVPWAPGAPGFDYCLRITYDKAEFQDYNCNGPADPIANANEQMAPLCEGPVTKAPTTG